MGKMDLTTCQILQAAQGHLGCGIGGGTDPKGNEGFFQVQSLGLFPKYIPLCRWMDSMTLGDRRWMLSGIPATVLMAFRIRLDAASIRQEFLPVTMVPSFSSIAAALRFRMYRPWHRTAFGYNFLAGSTTFLSSGLSPKFFINSSARVKVS